MSPETIIAINDERRRCAGIAIEFLLSTGADEAQALASPLVAKILRPTPEFLATPIGDDAYEAMGWDKSLRTEQSE